jgi:hypothetical protein
VDALPPDRLRAVINAIVTITVLAVGKGNKRSTAMADVEPLMTGRVGHGYPARRRAAFVTTALLKLHRADPNHATAAWAQPRSGARPDQDVKRVGVDQYLGHDQRSEPYGISEITPQAAA